MAATTTTSFVAARNLTPRRTSPSSPPETSRFFEPPHCSPYRPTTARGKQTETPSGDSLRGLQWDTVAALRFLQRAENECEIRDQLNLPSMPIMQSYWSGVVFKVQGIQMCHIPKLQ
ncbi:hypothetical protein ACFX15_016418 [Malus domestica]